jgi:acyl carrier protein
VTKDELQAGLAQIIWEVTGIPVARVTADAHLVDDLDIDSISTVEVIALAEERFSVRIPDESLDGLRTVGDVVTFIEDAQLRV